MNELITTFAKLRAMPGNGDLAQAVRRGKLRLVRVTYKPNGGSIVEPVSQWQDHANHLEMLKAMIR